MNMTNETVTVTRRGQKQKISTGGPQRMWVPDHITGTLKVTVNGLPIYFLDCILELASMKDILINTDKAGDIIVMDYEYLESTSSWSIEFDEFLESIGGLESGYRTDVPPITERGFFGVGDGWLAILKELIEELITDGWDKQVCQVKEKFGGLRFYTNGGGPNHHNIISKYEERSYITCEKCGEPGEPRKGGWILTLCDKHNEERESERQAKG